MRSADRDSNDPPGDEAEGGRDARSSTGIEVSRESVDSQQNVGTDVSYLLGAVVAERYLIHRLLGVGGMGAVFEAEHVHMKKLVALKILHSTMTINPEVVARFEREAVAAGRLQHPGIVTATDFGRLENGSFYLALEYVAGQSLSELLKTEGKLEPDRALRVAVQINSALCTAHAAGIIHRDLKPDNIMLVATGDDEDDFVKVLDFGIAKMRLEEEQQGESITRAGLVFGTPEYMSPEQAMGHEADARSDLYGLGMVLYETVQGRSPFRHEELTAMLTAQITEAPPPLPSTVPEPLARLIYRLLEKDPKDRPGSADELAEELMIVAERMDWPLPAPRTSAGTRLDLHGALERAPGTRRVGFAKGAIESVRSFSLAPMSIGNRRIPRWIPLVALLGGAAIGASAMLLSPSVKEVRQEPTDLPPPPIDAEAQLLADARSGDRDALSELRKLATSKQKELQERGLISADGVPKDLVPKAAHLGAEEQPAPGQEGEHPLLKQASRFLALGRGYSVIKHGPAALEMYERAVELDPHLADDAELLVDVRSALAAHDAVEEGLEFALEHLGAHGADLIYDVYLDHLGEAGMTPVVARAMKLVQSERLFEQASPSLQVALRLYQARVCAEYREIIPDAAAHADDRSVQKLRALTTRRGCGTYGNKDCFVCLRHADVPLEQAVQRAETHPSPVFLTPSEAAQEAGGSIKKTP